MNNLSTWQKVLLWIGLSVLTLIVSILVFPTILSPGLLIAWFVGCAGVTLAFLADASQYFSSVQNKPVQPVQPLQIIQNFTEIHDPPNISMPEPVKTSKAIAYKIASVSRLDDLYLAPDRLIGRGKDLTELNQTLFQGANPGRVVVQAFTGTGKSALAGELGKRWLASNQGKYLLWIHAEHNELDELLDAILEEYGKFDLKSKAQGEAKLDSVRQLLDNPEIGLVVIDDVRDASALSSLARAIPRSLPILATSQLRCDGLDKIYILEDLTQEYAIATLVHYSGLNLANDPSALKLCTVLGNLAFAIEIAGKTLKRTGQTVGELITSIEDAPHELRGSELGRENVAALINVSLKTLDSNTQTVFLAFGAFASKFLTSELLGLYFFSDPANSPDIFSRISDKNPQIPTAMNQFDGPLVRRIILSPIDTAPIERLLLVLHDTGLVNRTPKDRDRIAGYSVHELAYRFARQQVSDKQKQRAFEVCEDYARLHYEFTPENSTALKPVIETLLEAGKEAFDKEQWHVVDEFATWFAPFQTQLMGYSEYIGLLERGVIAAERRSDNEAQGRHLLNLGVIFHQNQEFNKAMEYLTKALPKLVEAKKRAYAYLTLGGFYAQAENYNPALEHFMNSYSLFPELDLNPPPNLIEFKTYILLNIGRCHIGLKNYDEAIKWLRLSKEQAVKGDLHDLNIQIDQFIHQAHSSKSSGT